MNRCLVLPLAALVLISLPVRAADPAPRLVIEEQPADAKMTKIVLVAGSSFFKVGEHEYVPACGLLADLRKHLQGITPVLAIDWPKKPETFKDAKAVVFFFDGAEKHAVLKEDRLAQVQKLADGGAGLVFFHQTVDFPKDLNERARGWTGGVFEKGHSQRAHWISEFKTFPEHAVCRGVTPFKIDDGWLYKLRFVPEKKGITPILRTTSPRTPDADKTSDDAVVAWTFERPGGGRSFSFTGAHLHASFAEEGYRRLLVNAILWTAGADVPATGSRSPEGSSAVPRPSPREEVAEGPVLSYLQPGEPGRDDRVIARRRNSLSSTVRSSNKTVKRWPSPVAHAPGSPGCTYVEAAAAERVQQSANLRLRYICAEWPACSRRRAFARKAARARAAVRTSPIPGVQVQTLDDRDEAEGALRAWFHQ